MSDELLFVYGTLRRGITSPLDELMAQHCEFRTDATMQGILFDVAGYPGVTESLDPSHRVVGEIYRVLDAQALWPTLDHYEQCSNAYPTPHEYIRKKLTVLTPDGENILAWAYLFNWDASGLLRIDHGDFVKYVINNG
ncbi:MAG: gamma-glutamylcyclotransferase family protein [Pseudomonadales bacterium]